VGWLIDASIGISIERGTPSVADVQAITRQDPVYLSPVNVAEIRCRNGKNETGSVARAGGIRLIGGGLNRSS
jgi:predicted nucleic acid-binding protein